MICRILSLCDVFFSSTNTGGWTVLVFVLYAKIIILKVPFIVYKYLYFPVDPNPPVPLSVSDNSGTSVIYMVG